MTYRPYLQRAGRADRPAASEHDEQVAVVDWFRAQHPRLAGSLVASANGLGIGGNTPGQKAAHWAKFLASGGCPGHADLFLMVASGKSHGLYVEMKKKKSSRRDVSVEQFAFIGLAMRQGYAATWCAGSHEAIAVITDYLGANA